MPTFRRLFMKKVFKNVMLLFIILAFSFNGVEVFAETYNNDEGFISADYSANHCFMQGNNIKLQADSIKVSDDYEETAILTDYSKSILSKMDENFTVIENLYTGAGEYNIENNTYCESDFTICAGSINNSKTVIADDTITLSGTNFIGENSILYSTNGSISLNCGDIQYSGIIYAPESNISINATNVDITGIVIAKNIEIYCDNLKLTADYSLIDDQANYYSEEIIDFTNMNESDQNGIDKLTACGHNTDFINSVPEDVVEQIAASPEAINKISYYKEVPLEGYNSDEEYSKVVPSSIDEFYDRTENSDSSDLDSDCLNSEENISAFSTSKKVDSGTLKVVTSLYSVSNGRLSQYLVISSFVWTTMPKYRGTDFFAITRDYNTAVVPKTFGSSVTYSQQKYILMANIGGVSSYKSGKPTTITRSYDNNSSDPLTGFAIKFSVPSNLIPNGMVAGSSAAAYIRYGLQGGCWYKGVLKQPSISPQNFNHWSTYCHQKSTTWFSSPSISVPLAVSVTVTPKKSYNAPVVDTILATWRKR